MISSPPKDRQTQKEKTEKDGIRMENVWRVCKQQADVTLDKQVLKDVPKKKIVGEYDTDSISSF